MDFFSTYFTTAAYGYKKLVEAILFGIAVVCLSPFALLALPGWLIAKVTGK